MNENLLAVLNHLLEVYFPHIRKPIRKNLAVLTIAFLQVLSAVRSGYGHFIVGGFSSGFAYGRNGACTRKKGASLFE